MATVGDSKDIWLQLEHYRQQDIVQPDFFVDPKNFHMWSSIANATMWSYCVRGKCSVILFELQQLRCEGRLEMYIYGISFDGHLYWYKHVGFKNGTDDWIGRKKIGTGWHSYLTVFNDGEGIIYGISASGSHMQVSADA